MSTWSHQKCWCISKCWHWQRCQCSFWRRQCWKWHRHGQSKNRIMLNCGKLIYILFHIKTQFNTCWILKKKKSNTYCFFLFKSDLLWGLGPWFPWLPCSVQPLIYLALIALCSSSYIFLTAYNYTSLSLLSSVCIPAKDISIHSAFASTEQSFRVWEW